MEKTDLIEISKSVGGKFSGQNAAANGVSIDTRTLKKGDIYFAIKGDKYDGHDFIKTAAEKGAVGIVASKLRRVPKGTPLIAVKDTLRALQEFSEYYRDKFDIKLIGVTGSNGKTTTKDLLSSIISEAGSVLATEGNLNNHIGVPLTLLKLTRRHKYCVLEMGTNHMGEIAALSEISKPCCGVITNAGLAHVGNFGSLKNIVKAKMELFKHLPANGWAVINNDDKNIFEAAKKIKCRKISFGISNKADVTASGIEPGILNTVFRMEWKGKKTKVTLPVPGLFNVSNALAAAAAALACVKGITPEKISLGIRHFTPPTRRMQVIKMPGGTILVNDAYNANPSSMLNSIENFSKMFYNKRKILVLGDMLELGKYGVAEHKKIGKAITGRKSADIVLATGPLSKNIARESGGKWFSDNEELYKYLKGILMQEDAVFFKASRVIALDGIVNKLAPGRN